MTKAEHGVLTQLLGRMSLAAQASPQNHDIAVFVRDLVTVLRVASYGGDTQASVDEVMRLVDWAEKNVDDMQVIRSVAKPVELPVVKVNFCYSSSGCQGEAVGRGILHALRVAEKEQRR